jgi:hypothetical protein
MNLRKDNAIVFFLVLFTISGYGQMATTLHEKYWFYRERLKYFVKSGEVLAKA